MCRFPNGVRAEFGHARGELVSTTMWETLEVPPDAVPGSVRRSVWLDDDSTDAVQHYGGRLSHYTLVTDGTARLYYDSEFAQSYGLLIGAGQSAEELEVFRAGG